MIKVMVQTIIVEAKEKGHKLKILKLNIFAALKYVSCIDSSKITENKADFVLKI